MGLECGKPVAYYPCPQDPGEQQASVETEVTPDEKESEEPASPNAYKDGEKHGPREEYYDNGHMGKGKIG